MIRMGKKVILMEITCLIWEPDITIVCKILEKGVGCYVTVMTRMTKKMMKNFVTDKSKRLDSKRQFSCPV